MHDICVSGPIRMLTIVTTLIDKAIAHCDAKKIDPAVMVNFRLAPDMEPFSRQIFFMTSQINYLFTRLLGVEPQVYHDPDVTFDQLKARLATARAYMESHKREDLDAAASKPVVVKLGANELNFTGQQYVNEFWLPNFYFHSATAYNILRHLGVEIGKFDYLGRR
jgi:hypothetical protein